MIQAPFPWFGGKSRVAHLVWPRFGNVPNYIEPFFGSGAVLLQRPTPPKYETVNDLDCYLANFWRAVQAAPDDVAHWADWPVNEADMHARHEWLVAQAAFRQRMHTDPDYYDTKIAGWWVWGLSQWIGGEWCSLKRKPSKQRPDLKRGKGIHKTSLRIPRLTRSGGIHKTSLRRPHLLCYQGTHSLARRSTLPELFTALQTRLRHVRVCCGDWSRICGPSPTVHTAAPVGVFLDPPYSAAERDSNVYAQDSMTVAVEVREWALEHGDDPRYRIALCGYDGEHTMPADWEVVAWKAHGGYGNQSSDNDNRHRERIWFSPHCLKPPKQKKLFNLGET